VLFVNRDELGAGEPDSTEDGTYISLAWGRSLGTSQPPGGWKHSEGAGPVAAWKATTPQ
jgi:hypothetical protein